MLPTTQSLGAASAAEDLSATKTMGASGTKMGDTKLLETTAREGMSLIDRFYNGGNRAHAEALDILVVVLDGVVRRMRQQYATRKSSIAEANAQIARYEERAAFIQPKQDKLRAELEEKKAQAEVLKAAIAKGEGVIDDSVATAKAALEKASLCQRHTEKAYIAGVKLGEKGYDSKGRALPGRDVNLRKKGTVAARRPGDMANCDDTALLATVEAVLKG